MDGTAIKTYSDSSASDCQYRDYLSGALNSTHTAYVVVTRSDGRKYYGQNITITIGLYDAPMIDVTSAKTEYYSNEKIDLTVAASDDDGIKYSSIWKGGMKLKECAGAAPCSLTGYQLDAMPGTTVTFEARAEDLLGVQASSNFTVSIK